MCCRYALRRRDLARAAEKLRARLAREADDHFNIPPGRAIPALRTGTAGREVAWLHWGLVPHWAPNSESFGTRLANARAESLAAKPSFRDALQTRRCVIPATGFYEWETRHDSGQPWYFHAPQDEPLYFAGLWETWTDPDGALLESCTLVTTAPNALMRPIHDRMPALLSVDTCEAWLAPHTLPHDTVARILQPAPEGALVAHRVGVRVNRLVHDDVACLAEVAPPAEQLGLGL